MAAVCEQFGGLELSVDKDTKTKTRKFNIRLAAGEDEETALAALQTYLEFVLNIYPIYTGLTASNIKLSQLPDKTGKIYLADVTWTSNPRIEVGEMRIRISGTGGTVTMTHSLETVAVQGDVTSGQLNGAMNVNQDGEAQGVEVYIPADDMTVEKAFASGTLTFAYIANLRSIRGTVNALLWNGFAPGEVLFTDYEASSGNTEMDRISFSFKLEPNVVPYTVAGYTFSSGKDGHDVIDIGTAVKYDKTNNIKIPLARWAAIHRVYKRTNFFDVLGF